MRTKEKDIRQKIKEQDLSNTVANYFPDLFGDNLKAIALMHSVELEQYNVGPYEDTEPDYIIFELRTKSVQWKLETVIELIFAAFDCCDESATIEVLDNNYARVKVIGHYHS